MNFLGSLFGKKKRTLRDLSVDDLTREQITLNNEQRKLDQEMERLDRDETQLKSEYANCSADSQKRAVARKIQDSRARRQGAETRAGYCHKMLRSINGFLVIKGNMDFFERVGVASALMNMDMSEVEAFINEATVEGTLQQDKLAAMLRQVTDGVERLSDAVGDNSLDNLMAELDSEAAGQKARETAVEGGLGDVMRELDAAAAKGAEAARRAKVAVPSQPVQAERNQPEAEG